MGGEAFGGVGVWRVMRPVKQADQCTRCGMCHLYCPDDAIEAETFVILLERCKGCGICAMECAFGVIHMEPEPGEMNPGEPESGEMR